MQWGERAREAGREGGKEGRRGHSLQSCEKSLVRGKVNVGEAGLVTTAGAELMPLDTTEDAGTWRARKSAPGLVGSSVGGLEGQRVAEAGGEEKGAEEKEERRREDWVRVLERKEVRRERKHSRG